MALTEHPRRTLAAPDLRRTVGLVAGDALAFLVFSIIGRTSHGEAAGPAALLQVVETATPFMVGWFLAAPVMGAFRADVVTRPRRMLARSALAWLIGWPIALGLRALIRHSPIEPTFALITLVTNMVLLLGWRGALAWLSARRRPAEPAGAR